MKAVIKIPIEEVEGKNISMWAYAEIETEVQTPQGAIDFYDALKRPDLALQGGLERKEWNKVIDGYAILGSMPLEAHEGMNKFQQWMVHELDKQGERLKAKEE